MVQINMTIFQTKRKRQKDSDDFGSNSGNILGNWDGTEKQLEKIMYKEL